MWSSLARLRRVIGAFIARRLAPTGALVATCGCAGASSDWTPAEHARIEGGRGPMTIVQLDLANPDPSSVLRQTALPVSPEDPELEPLLARMRATLEESGGVGLAAPQVGISRRVVLVRLGTRPVGQPTRVEIFLNPRIEWASPELDEDYEACLSVDGVGGLVRRAKRLRLVHDLVGGTRTVELAEWDARIAQHELDHLDGVLYVDKIIGALLPTAEVRRLRDEGHRKRGWIPSEPPPPPSAGPSGS
jgi:peptide deformylase